MKKSKKITGIAGATLIGTTVFYLKTRRKAKKERTKKEQIHTWQKEVEKKRFWYLNPYEHVYIMCERSKIKDFVHTFFMLGEGEIS